MGSWAHTPLPRKSKGGLSILAFALLWQLSLNPEDGVISLSLPGGRIGRVSLPFSLLHRKVRGFICFPVGDEAGNFPRVGSSLGFWEGPVMSPLSALGNNW